MARIAVAGFLHETNTFAQCHTDLDAFLEADAWPGLLAGPALPGGVAGANLAVAGFIQAATAAGHQVLPLIWTSANPSGLVTRAAFERIWDILEQALRNAGAIDALFLDLHGAMAVEGIEDGEGELLGRLRVIVGAEMPLVAALDFHANVSPRMVALADGFTVYRSYPHVDMADSGARALALLQRFLAGESLHKAYRQLPFLIPMLWQSTLNEPMHSLMQMVADEERASGACAALVPGFPLADVHDSGPSVLVYHADAAVADAVAQRLYDALLAQRAAFSGRLYSAAEAVAQALAHPDARPLILADTQDNPGGGGSGDTTDILHELVRRQASDACVGLLCDPAAAKAAHAAGIGATITLALGGQSGIGSPPLLGGYRVEALGSGEFIGTGPFYRGCRMALGPMARLSLNGIQILVSSHKQQAADQAMFRHLGLEPSTQRILVLKSSVHFRADFGPIARDILIVAASGENVADLRTLQYRRLRPGVAIG